MAKSLFSSRYDHFCRSLRQARKKQGITQLELARKLAKPQSYVSKFENGERRLDVVEFFDTAKAIGIDPIEFLSSEFQEFVPIRRRPKS